jgi:phosphotransferase system  glucose/maltose/N-acetylglucosamine-specific IIC component
MNAARWVRALPLLLSASILLIGAAWAFAKDRNGTGSVAAFTAGLILLGAWVTTAVVDWHEGQPQRPEDSPEQHEEDEPL